MLIVNARAVESLDCTIVLLNVPFSPPIFISFARESVEDVLLESALESVKLMTPPKTPSDEFKIPLTRRFPEVLLSLAVSNSHVPVKFAVDPLSVTARIPSPCPSVVATPEISVPAPESLPESARAYL